MVATFISNCHGMKMQPLVHFESPGGEKLAVFYLAVAMQHINKYWNDLQQNITTAGDVVTALAQEEGMANTVAELFSIRRTSPTASSSADAVQNWSLRRMKSFNENIYGDVIERIKAYVYAYSEGSYTVWQFQQYYQS